MKSAPKIRPLAGVACVGYVRVSSERQATEDKTSLADQRAAIEARVTRMGLEIPAAGWFVDDGFSGATVEKRPALASMIESCVASRRAKSTPGYIVVLNDSRWGRFDDPEESGYWRHHLSRFGWIVRFAEGDEVDDPMARGMMRFIGSAQASEHRRNIVMNARRGSRGSAERGYWRGEAPFGYLRTVVWPPTREGRVLPRGVCKATDERVSLAPEETREAPFVRRLFELYANSGHSAQSLTLVALREWPERNWTPTAILRVLKNRVYVGDVVGGQRTPEKESYGKANAHLGIVSPELFAAATARRNAQALTRRAARSTYALTGVVTCTECGLPLVGAGTNGKGTRFYKCRGFNLAGNVCKNHGSMIAVDRLEYAIRELLAVEFTRPAAKAEVRRAIDRRLSEISQEAPPPATEAIDREMAAVQAKIQRLVAAVAGGSLSDRDAGGMIAELHARLGGLESERVGVLRLPERPALTSEDCDRIRDMVNRLPSLLRGIQDPSELRGVVTPWIRAARFDRSSRGLTVEIWRVPEAIRCDTDTPAPASASEPHPDYVTRTIDLPARRRLAGGR